MLRKRPIKYIVQVDYPRVSLGAHPLAKKPEDSGYEVASSEEMASSSEDSASEDPINIAKGRGADLKEPEKAEIARTRKVQRNQAGGKKTVRGQKDPKVSTSEGVP